MATLQLQTYQAKTDEITRLEGEILRVKAEREKAVQEILALGKGPYKLNGVDYVPVKKNDSYFMKKSTVGQVRGPRKAKTTDSTEKI